MSKHYYENEVTSARILPAPVAKVFSAFSDPKLLAKWWGPHGFTNTFKEFNFVAGGQWDFIMKGPDGTEYQNNCEFAEIIPNKLVRIKHLSQPKFTALFLLDDLGEKTKLTFHQIFEDAATRIALTKIVIPANEENFDRMTSVLQANDRPA